MFKKLMIASAAVLMLSAGPQVASAYSPAPEVTSKAPSSAKETSGTYKTAQRQRRFRGGRRGGGNRWRGNRGRNIGLGIAAGIIGLGAAAAAAEAARRDRGSCRRVERRCANRYGWETRRWFRCVERRGC